MQKLAFLSRFLGSSIGVIAAICILAMVFTTLIGRGDVAGVIYQCLVWSFWSTVAIGSVLRVATRRRCVRGKRNDQIAEEVNAMLDGRVFNSPPVKSANEYSAYPSDTPQ
ncbi:hypothetical protein [Microbacterium terrisoli]|jgi:hypothetical protein|uniref:hypothetical protein n=1 Tax=Microbacterium terrisoli TaxID=3242192 RepID=UPI00280400CF|nr:hypothetical protein [Microbacterium protaetiae]